LAFLNQAVHLKNVPSLMVKIFKINTRSYYRKHQKEVDAAINLDGLTAHEEYNLVSPKFQRP
jgi:hypothetical protein